MCQARFRVSGRNGKTAPDAGAVLRYPMAGTLAGCFDDGGEGVGLEGRTADKGAVDVRLRHEFGCVFGFDGAAVLDAHFVCRGLSEGVGEDAADVGVGFLCFLGGGGESGADGPYGFIGDDDGFDFGGSDVLESIADLRF